jgi:hypothetical protein
MDGAVSAVADAAAESGGAEAAPSVGEADGTDSIDVPLAFGDVQHTQANLSTMVQHVARVRRIFACVPFQAQKVTSDAGVRSLSNGLKLSRKAPFINALDQKTQDQAKPGSFRLSCQDNASGALSAPTLSSAARF